MIKFIKKVWNAFKLHEEHLEAMNEIINEMNGGE